MKQIPLTQKQFAIVDDEDFDELNKYKWFAGKSLKDKTFYAQRREYKNGIGKTVLLHQQITGFKHKIIDHKNHNGLDNRKSNLRVCTHSQNTKNSGLQINNTSGFIGVSWSSHQKKWKAQIRKDKKHYFLGYFDNKEEAAHVVDRNALILFGEFAVLNFPERSEIELYKSWLKEQIQKQKERHIKFGCGVECDALATYDWVLSLLDSEEKKQ